MSTYGTHPDLDLALVRAALPKAACRDCVYRAATVARMDRPRGWVCPRCGLTYEMLERARRSCRESTPS